MKLPRKLTLNDRADFQAVRESGKTASSKHLVLATLPQPAIDHFRYALITSKKAGKAHERNHIRRLIRAVLVEIGDEITPGHHLVFIARWRAKEATHADLKKDILHLTKKLGLRSQGGARSPSPTEPRQNPKNGPQTSVRPTSSSPPSPL